MSQLADTHEPPSPPPPPPPTDADAVLSGGGEMGARMRAIDWSKTALGPVAAWPQSLKTCVRIVLTSRQPMFVWWGVELINLYNDAYKSIVGGKHPEALGQPASVVWREIWDQVGPRAGDEARIEGLEAGADDYLTKPFSARELLARVATHVQIARLRVAAEREREKLYDVFMQAPVPVAVFVGPEHRYEVANPPYCAMVGRPALVGMSVREAFPELGEHAMIAALDQVYQRGEAVRAAEMNIPMARGGAARDAFFTYVAQPLRGASGAVGGVIAVAFEVTEQVLARREREELIAALAASNQELDQFAYVASPGRLDPHAPAARLDQLLAAARRLGSPGPPSRRPRKEGADRHGVSRFAIPGQYAN